MRIVVVLLTILLVTGAVWLMTTDEETGGPAFEPIAESPRPPVEAAGPPILIERPVPAASSASPKALVERRNAAARKHKRAVEAFEAGVVSVRDVELAEIELLEARLLAGEIDTRTFHAMRVVLFERDVERLGRGAAAMVVSEHELEHARMVLTYERRLAGQLLGPAYAEARSHYLERLETRYRRMIDAGVTAPGELETAMAEAGTAFPAD